MYNSLDAGYNEIFEKTFNKIFKQVLRGDPNAQIADGQKILLLSSEGYYYVWLPNKDTVIVELYLPAGDSTPKDLVDAKGMIRDIEYHGCVDNLKQLFADMFI